MAVIAVESVKASKVYLEKANDMFADMKSRRYCLTVALSL